MPQGGSDVFKILIAGKDHRFNIGQFLMQADYEFKAVHAGHSDIGKQQIRMMRPRQV